jgi:ABC-2 type transport system permease protein
VRAVLGAFAPIIAVQGLSMGLAGTDYEQHRHFADAAERYRRSLVELMNGSLLNGSGDAFATRADSALWARLPPFEYAPPSLAWVLGNHAFSLGVLALWSMVATVLAGRAMRAVSPEAAHVPDAPERTA